MNDIPIGLHGGAPPARMVRTLHALFAARDQASVAEILCRAVRSLCGAERAAFMRRDGDRCHYVDENAAAPRGKGARIPLGDCIGGLAMLRGQTMVVEDVRTDPRIPPGAPDAVGVGSALVVPVGVSAALGAVGCYWARPHRPAAADIELLQALADSAATALGNLARQADLAQRMGERAAALEGALAERERAEQMLHESRQRLAGIVDTAMDAIISVDAEQRIVLFSPAAEAMFRCPAAQALGKPLEHFIPERLRPVHREHLRAFLASGGTLRAADGLRALRGLRADGEEFPIEASLSKEDLASGMLSTIVVRDISRRLHDQAARTASEDRLRYVTEAAEIGHWDWDLATNHLELSSRCRALFGIPPSEPMSYTRVIAALHPDDRARVDEQVRRALTGMGTYECEYRVTLGGGLERWIRAKGCVTFDDDGRPRRMGGIAMDVTERKTTELALREKQQLLQLFAEGAPAGIAMFDKEMRYLAVSRRYLDDYRLSRTDVVGRSHYEVFPEIGPQWCEIHRRCLAGETARNDEDMLVRADGSIQWVRWEICPWFAASGEVGGILLFSEEISVRKRTEDELKAAKAEAERANEAKSRFLAAASHDLRQPLSALGLYAKVLEGHVDAAGAPLLAKLKACLASLGELLSDLLDLSKLQAGVVTPNPADFAVAGMLANLLSVHEPEARWKGLALRCRPSALWSRTDQVLFQRIVGNIIDNAIRYTERGGVLVGCRRRRGKIWVEVWDTGSGIPADKTGEIFEEFRQLGEARTRGSGLGLAIVARTAALLGLNIGVRSRPGRGSVFAVELPPGQAAVDIVPQFDIVPGCTLRIALVEDNYVVREALSEALSSIGHEVVAAESGQALVAALNGQPPDVLVSDYRLEHGETGFDVIRSVRAAAEREVPAFLLTGDTNPDLVRNMAARGIVVLHKPVDLETLQAYLDDVSFGGVTGGQ